MDTQQFLAEFGVIANAPGGVARLRELVLHFAVTGKLVLQHSTDEHAEKLLERMRSTILRPKKNSRNGSAQALSAKQPVHDLSLPNGWVTVKLGEIGDWGAGSTPSRSNSTYYNGTIPWFKSGELKADCITKSEEHVTEIALKECSLRLNTPGDVLIAMYGANIGQAAIVGIQSTTNQAVCACTPHEGILNRYLLILLRSLTKYFVGIGAGGAQPNISREKIIATVVGLPPTAEQSRIVAKVDELMALCDKLVQQQQTRRQLQNNLRLSTLQALANASSPHELKTSWTRLEANFGRLFSEAGDVRAFKGAILDLAITGRLQAINGAQAASGNLLLQVIHQARQKWSGVATDQEQKEALSMLKKLRTQNVIPPEDTLPPHWCWASLLQVSQAIVDCHNKTAPYVADGIHLVRTTDIRDGKMDLRNTKKISEETYNYWARRMPPQAGDIFFTREAPMGEAAIVPMKEKVCLGQRTMLIRLFSHLFNNRFLLYVIQSPSFQLRMVNAAIGMTVKHLRVGDVENLQVPVPPIEEQNQIVEIIDRLFDICNRYEQQLEKKRVITTNLTTSIIANFTGLTTQTKEEPMKVPQTELIAPVRLGQLPDVKDQAPLATILARFNGELAARDLWQRFGGEIDAFYAQLKTEVAHGWILEPTVAEVREKTSETTGA